MEQFIHTIFADKLKPQFDKKLSPALRQSDLDSYLRTLHTEYHKARSCVQALGELSRLFRGDRILHSTFEPYLARYAADERQCLEMKSRRHVSDYYNAVCDRYNIGCVKLYYI